MRKPFEDIVFGCNEDPRYGIKINGTGYFRKVLFGRSGGHIKHESGTLRKGNINA